MNTTTKYQPKAPRLGFLLVTWGYVALALALGFLAPTINELFFPWLVSPLEKSAITAILSAIGTGMITLTGIVFSLAFVIVQFSSSAYSPRITRIFAHVRSLRHALRVFTGTFLYSLMAIRTVGEAQTETVSAFSIWMAFAWLLASIAILANLIRVFTTLSIGNILFAVSKAGRSSIARVYTPLSTETAGEVSHPDTEIAESPVTQTLVYDGVPLYVLRIDIVSLGALARKRDVVIHIPHAVGDSLRDATALAYIRGGQLSTSKTKIQAYIELGHEREFSNDPRYAIRVLVDMAIRGLSPAVNDPTTAVQALDHIEALLIRLGNAELDIGEVRDDNGELRLRYATPGWEDYLSLALSEIMQYGATSLEVHRRLARFLEFLSRSVPAPRAAVVDEYARARVAIASRAIQDATLRKWANITDHGAPPS